MSIGSMKYICVCVCESLDISAWWLCAKHGTLSNGLQEFMIIIF